MHPNADHQPVPDNQNQPAHDVLTMQGPSKQRARWAVMVTGGFAAVCLLASAVLFATGRLGIQSLLHPGAKDDLPTITTIQQADTPPAAQAENAADSPPQTVTPPSQATQAPASKPEPAKSAFATSITIDGDANCKSGTLAALELLATKAAAHYATVVQYVGVIKCVAQGSGMEAYGNPPRFLAGDSTRNAGTLWYAGTIAHDAGHSKLYHDYLAAHPGQSVPGDIWTGKNAEAACLDAQYDALQQMGADQGTLSYVQGIIDSEYWDVPYDNRWW